MKVSKITEAAAYILAKKNLEVFSNGGASMEFITTIEIAIKHLDLDEYIETSMTENECQSFNLITHHFVNYNDSSYPMRYDIKFSQDNDVICIYENTNI